MTHKGPEDIVMTYKELSILLYRASNRVQSNNLEPCVWLWFDNLKSVVARAEATLGQIIGSFSCGRCNSLPCWYANFLVGMLALFAGIEGGGREVTLEVKLATNQLPILLFVSLRLLRGKQMSEVVNKELQFRGSQGKVT
jgi:hypothetical protein